MLHNKAKSGRRQNQMASTAPPVQWYNRTLLPWVLTAVLCACDSNPATIPPTAVPATTTPVLPTAQPTATAPKPTATAASAIPVFPTFVWPATVDKTAPCAEPPGDPSLALQLDAATERRLRIGATP